MKQQLLSWWRQPGIAARRRRLWGSWAVLLGLGLLIVVAWKRDGGPSGAIANAATTRVQRGPLSITVVESGTVRPREQIVLKNRLDDPATIIFVVPEGKLVEKDELLVELDVTELENELVEQRIRVQNGEADLIYAQENLKVVKNQAQASIEQAELDYRFAQQDLKKYQEGEYPKLLNEAQSKIKLAEAELSQAEEQLKWSKILFGEKYLSQSELQQDEIAAQKAELDLTLAKEELALLKNFTYQRQIDQLESNVKQAKMALERTQGLAAANLAQAEANLKAREAQLQEERAELQEDETEIKHAKIYAPIAGMVLYASSVEDRWRQDEEPIETGTLIDEQQAILYLPTASAFNVEMKIPEVNLNKVRVGLPVDVSIDAIPGRTFPGKVHNIAQLPDSQSSYLNPNLKLYKIVVHLDSSEAQLRNGMSCRAEIRVEQYEDVLYVPIQSVTRVEGRPTVYLVGTDGAPEPTAVEIGMDNSRFVHVRSGLEEGRSILLSPPFGPAKPDSAPSTEEQLPDAEGTEPKQTTRQTPAHEGTPAG